MAILIFWDGTEEKVSIDPANLEHQKPISSTEESFLSGHQQLIKYKTSCEIIRLSDKIYDFKIKYDAVDNQKLLRHKVRFGTSTIRVRQGAMSGSATWKDYDDKYYNGTTHWISVDKGLYKSIEREFVERIKRKQARFKKELLAIDGCCAITGDTTVDALEAAHIIPSNKRGGETVRNGILLRADLHRLFDKGAFSISPKGIVRLHAMMSENYTSLLHGRILSNATVERVREALGKVAGKS